jgi:hypothetical protein
MARPNTDVFGHCIMCGCKMIEDKMINGMMQRVFTAQRSEATYLLDTGSQMRVAMCKKDVEALDGTETEYVMGAVKRGWQHELETYSPWSQDQKDKYMEKYGKLEIVIRSDNKSSSAVDRHFKEYKVKKDKKEK